MNKLSIRTHLLLLVLAISAPLLVLVGLNIYYDMQQTIEHTKSSLRSLMGVMINNTESKIKDGHQILTKLVQRPMVQQLDASHCDPALKDMHSVTSIYTNILYSDPEGNLLCSAIATPPGKRINNADKPWFKQVLQRQSFTISEPFQGAITGKWVAMLSMPIKNSQNQVLGFAHLPLDLAAFDPHIPMQAVPKGSRYGFFSSTGVLIWRNLDPEKVIGSRPNAPAARQIVQTRNGELESLAIDHVVRYFTVQTMPTTGWVAFMGVPKDAVYAQARQHAMILAAIVLLSIGLLLMLALFIAARISIPISKLARNARALHDGEGKVREIVSGPREVVAVALELNHMFQAQRLAELQLRESETRYALAVDGANDGIWDVDFIHDTEYLSPRWKQLLGYQDHELVNARATFRALLHPDDVARVFEAIRQHTEEGKPYGLEFRLHCKDGSYRWFYSRGQALFDETGRALRLAGSMTDITERKLVENDLRIAATAFESQEGMTVAAVDGTILRVNQAFSKITGYTGAEIIGQNLRLLQSGRHDAAFFEAMWAAILQTGTWEGEIWNRRKNGEIYPEYLIITAVKDEHGQVVNYVGTFTDITSKKAAADEIMSLAFYDPLTLLPNRRLLLDRLKQGLLAATRSGEHGGLLFIDLDNFKTLNDTLGHKMGDALLQQVAQRLRTCVRECDTVARLGGDEFVVMLENLSKDALEAAAQCKTVGEKILAALNQPYLLAGSEHYYGASIGATIFSDSHIGIDELLQQADIAMYQAKHAGRNLLCFFDPQMQIAITDRAALEGELHRALEHQQFCLHYQIQVDSELKPLGAEALLRWMHPERGMIAPGNFIPLAEESGLILPIGQWVLEAACAQLQIWQAQSHTAHLVLAVNVSAKQFRQPDFVEQVQATMQRYGIKPMTLKLELTESMLFEKIEEIIVTIKRLKALGLQISLDDFGTGYSSLQYLKRLPLDQLKIDQSFVRDLAQDSSDKAIVRTIIAMAQSLGLDVIAEGVETEQQKQILVLRGCQQYQGYLFGKPMPIEKFDALFCLDSDREAISSVA
jgi:diguanylate cyclase (GGDEF)-like protein/PAS domain S-box-containing protein